MTTSGDGASRSDGNKRTISSEVTSEEDTVPSSKAVRSFVKNEIIAYNPLFSPDEIMDERTSKFQAVFLDACILTDKALEDVYYTFGVLAPDRFALYAVDVNRQPREEWGTYIKLIETYYFANCEIEKQGDIWRVYSNYDVRCYIDINIRLYDELIAQTENNLWNWKISEINHVENKIFNRRTLSQGVEAATALANENRRAISDIAEIDGTLAHHDIFLTEAELFPLYAHSTFRGFRRSIGKVEERIKALRMPIFCREFDGISNPITSITIEIYSIQDGEFTDILLRKEIDCYIEPNSWFSDLIVFDSELDFSQYEEIGLGYYTDAYSTPAGNTALMDDSITTPGQYLVLNSNYWTTISGNGNGSRIHYNLYKDLRYKVKYNKISSTEDSVDVSLPDRIYAVVGDKLQIFFRGCIKAVNPYQYDILVSCGKGIKYPRYFEFTPSLDDVGDIPFRIEVRDNNGKVLGSAETSIRVVANSTVTPVKNILCFGDSLTSGGIWCKAADDRTPENIRFCGKKSNGTTRFFGVGGWDWSSYTTQGRPAVRFEVSGISTLSVGSTYINNDTVYTVLEVNVTDGSGNILCGYVNYKPLVGDSLTKTSGGGDGVIGFSSHSIESQNPLWDEGQMTFIPYASQFADNKVDYVYTLLSWNGQTPHRNDFSSRINEMKKFARTLHEEYPNAKLKIMGIQVPSVNGGMGANYGATGTGYADGYGMVVTALNQNKAYQDFCNLDEFKSYCEFINVSSQFDSEYNMPSSEKPVNGRNSEATEAVGTNGVHPSEKGYAQIGDIVYRSIMAEING